jgi:very-short-patch-repair endonuclease
VARDLVVDDDLPWEYLDEDPLNRLLLRQAGVVTTNQATEHLSEKAVRHRVASGRWRRVHRGVLLTHTGAITPTQRLWIASLAAGAEHPAPVGGLTALIVHGLRAIRSPAIHVIVPTARRVVVPKGVVVHRVGDLPPGDRTTWTSPPSTTPGRSVVDAVQWARSDNEARLIIASSFQQRLVRLDDIDRVAGRMLYAKRRSLLIRTAWDCADGSESLGELDLLNLCRRAGLPLPSRQVQRRDRFGRKRYLDAVFEEWMVAIEVDGAQHGLVQQTWDDSSRQNELELAGYTVLRYPAFVVRDYPEHVAAELRQALTQAGWVAPQ